MEPDEDGVYQLKGSDNVKGGLIIKKKAAPGTSVEFKVPKVSLLGLDKLAGKFVINSIKKGSYNTPKGQSDAKSKEPRVK